MKRILFFSSQDTRRQFNYNSDFQTELYHLGGNSGNMVFTNAIQTYISQNNIDYDITYDTNKLKNNDTQDIYSCCIVNCSNWLRPANTKFLQRITEALLKTKIPVYFIGLGTQTTGNFTFSDFDENFIVTAKNFVGSVIDTGGELGLRGAYTAEFLEYLGFKYGFEVTGCPSMYQMGKNLEVDNTKVHPDAFSPVFNGDKIFEISNITDSFKNYQNSVFVDQDRWLKILKFSDNLDEAYTRQILTEPELALELFMNDRIKLFTNIRNWINFIQTKNYNFSFGSRFHGSVVPILCGIPSLILTHDSRTKELSDFFKIPTIDLSSLKNKIDLYDQYLKTDYSDFNKNYPLAYNNLEKFISRNRIPIKLPDNKPNSIAPKYDEDIKRNEKLKALLIDYLSYKPHFKIPFLDKRKQFIIKKGMKITGNTK